MIRKFGNKRYILGNQNLSLKQLLEILSDITGLKAPQISVPAFLPVAWIEEKIFAPMGKTPTVPIDGVRMAQQPMYYDASKAIRELCLPQSSLKVALKDAVDWFVSNGYVK
jgi:dihydroflavonol-4-reductase